MEAVLLFPGQGSQKPGMGKELVAAYPAARAVFDAIDAALGEPLSSICFEGPAETLMLTQNAQPALVAHGLAAWAVLKAKLGPFVRATAGHSLGEFTAYAAAEALDVRAAARLVRARGTLMYEAGQARPGAMAAILGATNRPIDEICAEASAHPEGGEVVAANYNTADQTVVSGEVAGVEKVMDLARLAGARRAIRLAVSGAFHSPLMAPARDGLAAEIRSAGLREPRVPVYANVNAEPVQDAATAARLLEQQLTAPVRWLETVTRLARDFPAALFIELGPGTVLSGMVKKIAAHVETMSCGSPPEVETLLARVSA